MKTLVNTLIFFFVLYSSNLSAQSQQSQSVTQKSKKDYPSLILLPSKDGIKNTSLVGVWQRSIVDKDSIGVFHINTLPLLKFLSADNTMKNITIESGGICSVIVSQGEYRHPSDSIYIEYLENDKTPIKEEDQKIRVRFLHDNLIELDFSMPKYTAKEYWLRLPVMK